MSKDKSINDQNQLDQWLDDFSDSANTPDFSDEAWQGRAQTAAFIRHQANIMGEQEVPHWQRDAAMDSTERRWWQWQGLPALSMAFSFMALTMVIFKVEFIVKPEGMMISFAGNHAAEQEKKLAELVDQRLQTFASEQQVMLANYTSDLKSQQQDSNLQLANYIMTTSREERREDMTDFIQYVNQQMQEDQFTQQMKFKQIEQTLNYQNNLLNSVDIQAKPAIWIEEDTTDE